MSWSKAFLLFIPLLPALAGALPLRRPKTAGVVTSTACGLAASAAAFACVQAYFSPSLTTLRWSLTSTSPISLGLQLDRLSATMALLITLVGCCVLRFAARYLEGDAEQVTFLRRVSLTIAAVAGFALAGDLLVLLGAWILASLVLHRLLTHYPQRPAGVRAAKAKFLVSRLAEGAVLCASVLLYRSFGTLEFETLFLRLEQASPELLQWPALLLVCAALLKSAQFPFHSWLPDTMETPTPVSALMHAGIINAGGFLMIRMSPLLGQVPIATGVLALAGATTAAFGALVMLTQPSVKRALAYSTIAQMGFMLLECGLGLFGLALLHIMAHSVYKASAFLRAGSAVNAAPRSLVPLDSRAILASLTVATGLVLGASRVGHSAHSLGAVVMAVILALSIAYGLTRYWAVSERRFAWMGLSYAAAFTGAATLVHSLGATLVPARSEVYVAPWLALLLCTLFIGLFAIQVSLWRMARHALGRALYVHALNGFYVSALVNRALERWWPPRRYELVRSIEPSLAQRMTQS
ncbi:MAG TPA: proton-conducting transporter membrane subunit [Polyangiaceae bacterium]|nr:proton-conducting transporter membrane subunit [Polyangiaceae bacterium]